MDERTRLWHWPDVARWLNEHRKAGIEIDTDAATLVAAMNAAFNLREHAGHLPSGDRALIGQVLADSRLL